MAKEEYIQLTIEGFAVDADRELSKLDLPEIIVEPFDPNEIRIIPQTLSIDSIISRIENDEINLNTEFQRKANLWDDDVQSRLIESLMLKLPLPAFYFDASEDDKWLIVDGLQRLSTLNNFIIKENLVLTGLDILKAYDNKRLTYSNLPRMMQRRIREANITCFLISPGTPKKVKYNVFKRINTGALSLNDMEIRNALNQGPASTFLKDFTESTAFRKLIKLPNERMEDRELVLRCIAFIITDFSKYESPLSAFLDSAMEKMQNMSSEQLKKNGDLILRGIEIQTKLFGRNRFSRSIISTKLNYRLNSALFETWIVVLASLTQENIETLYKNQNKLKASYIALFDKKDFNDSIVSSTASKKAVTKRFKEINKLVKEYI